MKGPHRTRSEMVRKPGDWMSPKADDRILETIREMGNMTPLALSRDGEQPRLDMGRTWASERCRVLTRYGLLRKLDRGLYAITDEGIAYLEGELDARELEPIDDVENATDVGVDVDDSE